ncbi:MAG: hypothetical protein GY696_31405 [Gammaproteobacteria bacterium]|nr:hypothetical protein [Gammaproteobacteria bacterium]
MTCPHYRQNKVSNEACQPRHGGDASPSTGQAQALTGPGPTFQAGERVWYLDTQPSRLDPTRMDGAWTWPWVVFFKEAPDLYHISAYSRARGQTIRTAHIGRLRQSLLGRQEGSVENRPEVREGELPEEPEEPLPEEPLPEELRPEEPLSEEPLPDLLLPEEEEAQITHPQISTPFSPTGLAFICTVEPTTPVSMRPCHNERRSSPFWGGGDLPILSAWESGLSSLEGFNPGVEPIGPAGVGLPGVKMDWLAKTAEWASSHNLSKLNENRAPTLTACEEGVPAPLQSVRSRVEIFISGIQGDGNEAQDLDGKPTSSQKDKEAATKGGGEDTARETQPPELHPQGTGR